MLIVPAKNAPVVAAKENNSPQPHVQVVKTTTITAPSASPQGSSLAEEEDDAG